MKLRAAKKAVNAAARQPHRYSHRRQYLVSAIYRVFAWPGSWDSRLAGRAESLLTRIKQGEAWEWYVISWAKCPDCGGEVVANESGPEEEVYDGTDARCTECIWACWFYVDDDGKARLASGAS